MSRSGCCRPAKNVVGLDSINDYYDPALKQARLDLLGNDPRFRFVKMDLADERGMAALFGDERFEVVVHLAAQAGGALLAAEPAGLYFVQPAGLR